MDLILECIYRVVTLCMSPVDDTFLSGSLDKTIRLWDLRSPNCQVWCIAILDVCIYLTQMYVCLIQVLMRCVSELHISIFFDNIWE